MQHIRRLLSRHAQSAQVRIPKLKKSLRRERLNRRLESDKHRLRRLQRHLLFEDDVNESLKSGGAAPERRVAVNGVYLAQHLIARSQLACCQRETLFGENQLRVATVASVRKFSNRMRPSRDSFGCSQRVRFLFQSSNDFSR